jgi:predicted transcriptional regulator
MKLLLYCTKNKWRLFFDKVKQVFTLGKVKSNNDLNGKIVAECDYEVEEIKINLFTYKTDTLGFAELCEKSCLDFNKMYDYFHLENKETEINEVVGYAIHIKNLHIFDEPKELQECATIKRIPDEWHIGYYEKFESVERAPQNMQYVYDVNSDNPNEKKVLISIKPELLCKILNKEKTIEVRRVVLKEMLKND